MSTTISTDEELDWPSPGQTLASRYELREVIGRGGTSVIYRAREMGLGREVALKVLNLRAGPHEDVNQRRRRFYRSARLMAQLNAPSTIAMFDYGRTPDGLVFLVFEYIDGQTLEDALRGGPLHPERARGILLQVLESLREAHQHQFLHRDIKPANIMLVKRLGQGDSVKVLDYGSAKQIDPGDSQEITHAGHVVGTPRYLAPERIAGKPFGPPSDIFSLGLVTYAMLVGQSPIAHLGGTAVLEALTTEQFELPAGVEVDPQFRAVVNKMLAREPHRRYQTVDQVFADLGVEVEPLAPVRPTNELVAFPLDLDPLGGTPIDELTGTTSIQTITLAGPTVSDLPPSSISSVTTIDAHRGRDDSDVFELPAPPAFLGDDRPFWQRYRWALPAIALIVLLLLFAWIAWP